MIWSRPPRWSGEYDVRAFHFRKMREAAGILSIRDTPDEHEQPGCGAESWGQVCEEGGRDAWTRNSGLRAFVRRCSVKEHPSTPMSTNNLAFLPSRSGQVSAD